MIFWRIFIFHFMFVESTSFVSAIALADALMVKKGLRLLDVCNNEIGDAGAADLASALLTNTTVVKVDW